MNPLQEIYSNLGFIVFWYAMIIGISQIIKTIMQ